MYNRGRRPDPEIVDQGEYGFGWIADPEEGSKRASHAFRSDDEIYLFDPLYAEGIEDEIEDMEGEVAGVGLLSSYHTRDSGEFAEMYDVPVFTPEKVGEVLDGIEAETVEVPQGGELGDSGFEVETLEPASPFQKAAPMPRWRETVAYREEDGTLYTPDLLSRGASTGDEEIGVYPLARPFPPEEELQGPDVERILSGHEEGVMEDAEEHLEHALENARSNLPQLVRENGYDRARMLLGAIRH